MSVEIHRALSREQVRLHDKIAIENFGIPGIVLMENAARAAAYEGLELIRAKRQSNLSTGRKTEIGARAAVLCGGGNNGGDGYAIARRLHCAGVKVEVFAVSDPRKLTGDAAINFHIIERMKLPLREIAGAEAPLMTAMWARSDLLVDAMLGTGFSGVLRPELASVIDCINLLSASFRIPVLAVDVPSGLDCDTGLPCPIAVRADATVTFVAEKKGFRTPEARAHLGKLHVAGIGAPKEILEKVLSQINRV